MSTTKEAVKLLKSAVKDMAAPVYETAISTYIGNADIVPSVKIPFEMIPGAKTKELMPYIKEYGLDKPENMIRFLIDLHFACFESVNNGINCIRSDLLNSTISAIKAAKREIRHAEKVSVNLDTKIDECISKLNETQCDLEGKINSYIGEIKAIDNRNGMAFFIRAKIDIGKVDNTIALATKALQAYIESANLMYFFAMKKGEDVSDYIGETKKFIKSLSENGSISLMAAYDKAKDDTYWNSTNLQNSIENMKNISDELQELIEDYEEDDDDFDLENDVKF